MADTYNLVGKMVVSDAAGDNVEIIPFDASVTGAEGIHHRYSFAATQTATAISLGTITTATNLYIKVSGTITNSPTFKLNGGTTAITVNTGGEFHLFNTAVTGLVLDWTRNSDTLIVEILASGA